MLEPDTLDRIPKDTNWSIERSYFPSLVERQETFVAYVYRGYWIDIGTPEKYVAVHRDIMDGRFQAAPFAGHSHGTWSSPAAARIDPGAEIAGPCFIDEGAVVKAGARIGPHSVIGRQLPRRGGRARRRQRSSGPTRWIGREAQVTGAVLGRNCHVGRNATIRDGAILGDKTAVTDYTRL